MQTLLWETDCRSPWLNLALEETLFERLRSEERILFLWINDPAVIIGRNQNPWLECDLDAMRRLGVVLARRRSGGGAVYHDGGNLNYSLMQSRASYDRDECFRLIIAALLRLGIGAERTERNDIVVSGSKVSGTAFRFVRDRVIQHGTLLVSADLSRLRQCIAPAESSRAQPIETKAIRSVRSVVACLTRFSPRLTMDEVQRTIAETVGGDRRQSRVLTTRQLYEDRVIAARAGELQEWDWLYGHTPAFTVRHGHHTDTRSVALRFVVRRGCVVEVAADSAGEGVPASLRDRLIGRRYGDVSSMEH